MAGWARPGRLSPFGPHPRNALGQDIFTPGNTCPGETRLPRSSNTRGDSRPGRLLPRRCAHIRGCARPRTHSPGEVLILGYTHPGKLDPRDATPPGRSTSATQCPRDAVPPRRSTSRTQRLWEAVPPGRRASGKPPKCPRSISRHPCTPGTIGLMRCALAESAISHKAKAGKVRNCVLAWNTARGFQGSFQGGASRVELPRELPGRDNLEAPSES